MFSVQTTVVGKYSDMPFSFLKMMSISVVHIHAKQTKVSSINAILTFLFLETFVYTETGKHYKWSGARFSLTVKKGISFLSLTRSAQPVKIRNKGLYPNPATTEFQILSPPPLPPFYQTLSHAASWRGICKNNHQITTCPLIGEKDCNALIG